MALKRGILILACLLLSKVSHCQRPANNTNGTESQDALTTIPPPPITPTPSALLSDLKAGENSSLPSVSSTPSTNTTLSTIATVTGNETGPALTATEAPPTIVSPVNETTVEVPTPNGNGTSTTSATTISTTGPTTASTITSTEVSTENKTSAVTSTTAGPASSTAASEPTNSTTASEPPTSTTASEPPTSTSLTPLTTTTSAPTTTSELNPNSTTNETSEAPLPTTPKSNDHDPYANARSAGIGSFFGVLFIILVVGGVFWYYRWKYTGNSPYLQHGGPFGPLALRPGTSDLSPPPPAPPGNFRFAMGPTNNSTYNIMPSEELRQRSSNGGFDSSSVRREPLRASESFDPFDPRSNDDGSEGQFVNKTDTIVL